MSRLPRHLEHLRTGFTAEAASAATFRAFAERASADGKPNLARRWRALAEEKDRLAIELLGAAGKVAGEVANLRDALAEEQYEIEVLYPRLRDDLADSARQGESELMERVRRAHERHGAALDQLRRELMGATGDVREPAAAHAG
jgi:rubrerythrin